MIRSRWFAWPRTVQDRSPPTRPTTRDGTDTPVPGTVFENYDLVGVQYATKLGTASSEGVYPISPAYPNGDPNQRFLANTLIETYIQGFSPDYEDAQSRIVPIADTAVFGGGASRVTSTCVGCHADASQRTGFDANYVYMPQPCAVRR